MSAPAFDDSSWSSGPAQLGYGDGDEATVVSFGIDPANKYITTYFRQEFTVVNPGQVSLLTVKFLRDDGGVVYLNGVEEVRSNMPAGGINYLTMASVTIGGADESIFFEYDIATSNLVSGTNVAAVEIHQAAINS